MKITLFIIAVLCLAHVQYALKKKIELITVDSESQNVTSESLLIILSALTIINTFI